MSPATPGKAAPSKPEKKSPEKQALDQQGVDKILDSGVIIPPRPEVLMKLEQMAQNENVDLRAVAQLITTDVALSAAVFRLAGSPVFGLQRKPNSIEQAIPILGLKKTISIVRSESLRKAVSGQNYPHSYAKIWERFNEIGLLAAIISDSLKLRGFTTEQAFTAGMFCDCGVPVLMDKLPQYCAELKKNPLSAWPDLAQEDSSHNTSHTVVGHLVARNWRLPDFIAEAIRNHHEPQYATPETRQLIAVLQLALHIHNLLDRIEDSEWYRTRDFVLAELDIAADEERELMEEVMDQFRYAN